MKAVRWMQSAIAAGGAAAMIACGSTGVGLDPAGTDSTSTGKTPPLLEALPRPLTTLERGAVTAGTDFTFGLFREVNKRKAGNNVFVSPLSAAVALAMTAQGSAGATETAMRTTLGFPNQTLAGMGDGYRGLMTLLLGLDPSVTLRSANAIWYSNILPVEPSFIDASKQLFNADVRSANFADVATTLGQINGWVSTQTNGKITKVLDAIEADQRMFLLNALYFKGAWRDKFDARLTAPATFTNAGGSAKQVPTMHRDGSLKWMRGDGYQAVDLPYGNGAFSMTVLLPDAGRTADALATSLDAAGWATLVAALHPAPVNLSLPKFTLTYDDEWTDVLTTLGMGVAFTDRADFTRISRQGGLQIAFVKQNTFVDVNEEGTEAAAVTTVGIVVTSAPVAQVMRVDRPFVFAIRERLSGAVLFVGKVNTL
jgi:serpin B